MAVLVWMAPHLLAWVIWLLLVLPSVIALVLLDPLLLLAAWVHDHLLVNCHHVMLHHAWLLLYHVDVILLVLELLILLIGMLNILMLHHLLLCYLRLRPVLKVQFVWGSSPALFHWLMASLLDLLELELLLNLLLINLLLSLILLFSVYLLISLMGLLLSMGLVNTYVFEVFFAWFVAIGRWLWREHVSTVSSNVGLYHLVLSHPLALV